MFVPRDIPVSCMHGGVKWNKRKMSVQRVGAPLLGGLIVAVVVAGLLMRFLSASIPVAVVIGVVIWVGAFMYIDDEDQEAYEREHPSERMRFHG